MTMFQAEMNAKASELQQRAMALKKRASDGTHTGRNAHCYKLSDLYVAGLKIEEAKRYIQASADHFLLLT